MKLETKLKILIVSVCVAGLLVAAQAPGELETSLLEQVLALGGIGALVGLLIDLGKRFGVVGDGKAPIWNAGVNIVLMALMLFLPELGIAPNWGGIDSMAGWLYEIGLIILNLLGLLGGARLFHFTASGTPLAYSHS